jgi:hypothetical protein
VSWALASLPRERWASTPPSGLDAWPALRHVRHLAVRETRQLLPAVARAMGETAAGLSAVELEQAEAGWDPPSDGTSAEAIVAGLAAGRFELLQRLERYWGQGGDEASLEWLVLRAHQHELQHAAAIWRLVLYWDRVSRTALRGVPLHPADRLEESH